MNGVHIGVWVLSYAKAMIFLKRGADLSAPEFQQWWLTKHRPLAECLPGLVRHSFNALPEGAPYDAVVEQWFETVEDVSACYASEAGKAVIADSAAHTSLRVRVIADAHDFSIPAKGQ